MMNITFENVIMAIINFSVVSVFIAVLIDFTLYNDKNATRQSQKSIVATGSMIGFYVIYYMVVRFQIGVFDITNNAVIILGTCMIVIGSVVNVFGRLHLGGNWANHIKIYDSHTLVTNGMYKIVRHPLYSSIMFMLFGGSIAYRNCLSAVLTAFVFIPFMYYRAKQEEKLLTIEFDSYNEYKKKTGMFFPKIWR